MRAHIISNWDAVPVIIDVPYAAILLGQTPEAIKRRCRNGTLPAFKIGVGENKAEWRIEKEELIRYIRGQYKGVT